MKIFKTLAAGALLAVSSLSLATPLHVGTWGLEDGSSLPRGLWTDNGLFTSAGGSFTVTGTNATLTGSVFSSTYNGGLDFSVSFNFLCSSTVTDTDISNAGNRYVSVDSSCGLSNQRTGGAVTAADVSGQTWDFWNWAASSYVMTGTGDLDGLTFDVSQKPSGNTKPFRVGTGANWDDASLFGGSGWMYIDNITCQANASCQNSGFNATTADFNYVFTNVSAPATLMLFGGLLVGLVGFRRR